MYAPLFSPAIAIAFIGESSETQDFLWFPFCFSLVFFSVSPELSFPHYLGFLIRFWSITLLDSSSRILRLASELAVNCAGGRVRGEGGGVVGLAFDDCIIVWTTCFVMEEADYGVVAFWVGEAKGRDVVGFTWTACFVEGLIPPLAEEVAEEGGGDAFWAGEEEDGADPFWWGELGNEEDWTGSFWAGDEGTDRLFVGGGDKLIFIVGWTREGRELCASWLNLFRRRQ